MSTSKLAPYYSYNSFVFYPPLKAWDLILSFICLGVSVKNIAEFILEVLIFWSCPNKLGKNLLCIQATFGTFNFSQWSLVILKYGSWSIPYGTRQGTILFPKIWGNEDETEGAA